MSENRKRIDYYIDLSNGDENYPVKFPKKYNNKLEKSNFNYEKNYITKSFIRNRDINDYSLSQEYSCKCSNFNEDNEIICNEEECECLNNHNQKYECNSNCECSDSCFNRRIQKGLDFKLLVNYVSNSKGFGVFALEDIKKDNFVCEYIGEYIDKKRAHEKIHLNEVKKKCNYILQMREIYKDIIINTYIDAEEKGNLARFINHSCDPNLYFEIIRVNHFIPRIAFFAKRNIEKGEELHFSYVDDENNKEDDFKILNSQKACECKSNKCKKFLPSY